MKTLNGQKGKKQKDVVGLTFGDLCDKAVDKTFQDKKFMKFAKSTKRYETKKIKLKNRF